MNFTYFVPTKILFGAGQLNRLHEQELPGKKALIVISAGKSTRANGYLERTENELKKAGVESVVFDKILPNPTLEHVMDGADVAKNNSCDFVIGLGGGSSIDAAKSIAIMATNPGNYWDYINGGTGKGKPLVNSPLPIVAITTTAGTGTEADPWTVITKEDTQEKIGYGYDKTFPVLSIVDPELMLSVPKDLTVYQGFDALFHSTEGYINKTAYVMSDMYALEAIRLVGKSLAKVANDGTDLASRGDIALANTLSGLVESTSGCTSEHSLEHAMSACYPKLAHGAGLIMISREYYSMIASKNVCNERMIDMAKALGKTDASTAMDFVSALVDLQKACGVDNLKMSEIGIKEDELLKLVEIARDTMGGLFEVDPTPLSNADCLEIMQKSFC